ncbi:MAG: hypothetical protein ACE5EV_06105, partial [Gaiellales bacterium]
MSGEIVVGGRLLVCGALYGAEVMAPTEDPASTERTPPIILRPDAGHTVDREVELEELESSVAAGAIVQIVGEHGVGRTTLLRHLAHGASTDDSPDGVIYVAGRGLRLEDLLGALYDAVVVSSGRTHATPGEVSRALGNKRLLVIIDDLELAPSEADELAGMLPSSALVVATRPGLAVRDAKVIPLGGLPIDASTSLLAEAFGQEPGESERETAMAIASAVGGNPSRLLQAAALCDFSWPRLAELADQISASGPSVLVQTALGSLSEVEQRVLAAVALPDGAPVHGRHLQSLS